MHSITEAVVRSVGTAGNIALEHWPALEKRISTALREYAKANALYSGLQTKREKVKFWEEVDVEARTLSDRLRNPWVIGCMISHETLVCRKPTSAAEQTIEEEVKAAHALAERVHAFVENLKARPENRDERLARTGSAKPSQLVFDSYIVTFWEQTTGKVSFTEGCAFIEFFRAFDEAARPSSARNEPLSIATIKSRVARMKKKFAPIGR